MATKVEGNVELLTVEKLSGMKFRIPSYQRGYRWRKGHVKTLLEDLDLFKQDLANPDSPRVYSLQPLVVKKTVAENTRTDFLIRLQNVTRPEEVEALFEQFSEWEVIDGQQRLTTLFLLLAFLQVQNIYSLSYDTRSDSKEFLGAFGHPPADMEDRSRTNIDFCRMYEVYNEIQRWFSNKSESYREEFRRLILERVQFIWYESVGERAIEVFTRLNIGNIKLTDAELIKALILDQASFLDSHGQHFRDDAQLKLARGKISAEWDAIEQRLQDDAFWLYVQPYDPHKKAPPTRIDFLLERIAEFEPLAAVELDDEVHDDHKLFRRYERYFRNNRQSAKRRMEARLAVWDKISDVYHVLEEWFEDPTLYHYTGYLMALRNRGASVGTLLSDWYGVAGDRVSFCVQLENRMKDSLEELRGYARAQSTEQFPKTILDINYDGENLPAKSRCTPLLLLHNVLTVIHQGEVMSRNSLYRGQRVFYKFPFNLYKREQWEIEHVDPRTDNGLDKVKDQKDWLFGVFPFVCSDPILRDQIIAFCNTNGADGDFADLRSNCENAVTGDLDQVGDRLQDNEEINEKNRIWNFVLLDGGTNSSYGNSLFPAKRRILMQKEQGTRLKNGRFVQRDDGTGYDIEWDEDPVNSPFVPPCTKQVFLQYYSGAAVSPFRWSRRDAQSYYDNLKKILERYL